MGYAGFTLCWTGMNCTFIPYIFDKNTLSMIFIGSPDGERSDTTTSCCKRTNQYAVGNRRVSPTSRFPFHLCWSWHLKTNLLRSFTFSRCLLGQTVDDIKILSFIILIIEGMTTSKRTNQYT